MKSQKENSARSSTLRLSSKGIKDSPRIVFRWGRDDEEIRNYLKYRREIRNLFAS